MRSSLGEIVMLVKCKECGGRVSDDAKACPHCGAVPRRRLSVGRIVLGVLIGFAALYWYGTTYGGIYTGENGEVKAAGP
jgi:hypothetical protein